MPQITVDYSAELADDFDRPAFARALHTVLADIADARPPACKTRFRRVEDVVVGPDAEGHALVHIDIALLFGRTDDTKTRLTTTVLDLLRRHVKPADGRVLHASAEARDLEVSYRASGT